MTSCVARQGDIRPLWTAAMRRFSNMVIYANGCAVRHELSRYLSRCFDDEVGENPSSKARALTKLTRGASAEAINAALAGLGQK